MTNLVNRQVAMISGASRGIGFAIADRLARLGYSLAIFSRDLQRLESAATQLRSAGSGHVFARAIDVGDAGQVKEFVGEAVAEFGGLDVLVNNAGVGVFHSAADLTPEDWRKMIDTNLSGVFYCCHEAVPHLRQRGGGHIINISSLAARNAFAGGAGYNASKFGLHGLTEALMLDHRNDKILVTEIMPGSVNTEFARGPNQGDAATPDWKMATEDVAAMVVAVLGMHRRTLVSRIEMRPSMPPPPVPK